MVTSTSISRSCWFVLVRAGSCGRRAAKRRAGWSGSVGQNRSAGLTTTGPGYVTSGYRVKPASHSALRRCSPRSGLGRSRAISPPCDDAVREADWGGAGPSVIVRRRTGRSCRRTASTGSLIGHGDGGGIGLGCLVRILVVVIVVVLVILIVVFVVAVVFIIVVFVVEIDLFSVVVVSIVFVVSVFVVSVVVAVLEVVVLQVFFQSLPRDLFLQLLVGVGVLPALITDRFILVIGVRRLVGVVVMATIGRGHGLEHRVLGCVAGHLGDRRLFGLALLGPPAPPAAARLRFATGRRCRVDGIGVQHDPAAAAVRTRRRERLDQPGSEPLAGQLDQPQ